MAVRGWGYLKRAKSALAVTICALGLLSSASGQQPAQSPPQPAEEKAQEAAKQANAKIQELAALARARPVDATIGPGDLLHIDVFDVPELAREVRISQAGDLSYPLIPGKIPAAGMTTFQLETKIEELLVENGLVSHPQVSVFVKEQVSQPITVVGAVGHPTVYQAIRPVTLLEVLSEAGGIADTAGAYVTITRRKRANATLVPASSDVNPPAAGEAGSVAEDASGDTETITIQLQDLLETGNPAFNIPVYGGDVIRVPRAGVIYALGGGINQPGGYVIQERGEAITVLKLIALAHGLTGFAKSDSAVIMRNNPITGKRDAIPVKIKQIENRKVDDVAMQSNDILYVPDSAGKKALARGAEAAVSIGSGVILYKSVNGGV
jgi:polysaccharide biosynthesis/export protein